jgi:hypothetical protein
MHQEITLTFERDEESEMLVASWDDHTGKGGITTQGADLKELQEMASEASALPLRRGRERPGKVRPHFVTDPVLATMRNCRATFPVAM